MPSDYDSGLIGLLISCFFAILVNFTLSLIEEKQGTNYHSTSFYILHILGMAVVGYFCYNLLQQNVPHIL